MLLHVFRNEVTEDQKAKRREAQRRRRAADPLYREKARLAVVEWRRRRDASESSEHRTERRTAQLKYHKEWRDRTRGRTDVVEARRQNYRNWYHRTKNDPQTKIKHNLRARMAKAVTRNQKAGSAVRNLGCSIEFLQGYLTGQFDPGMSWDNHGDWHIDHIQPLASFDLTDPEQFRQAAHYSNLRPLWASENLSKGAR